MSREKPPVILLEQVELHLASTEGQVNILQGLDLRVGAGEAVGLVGPSGSGKSSTLMIIAGLEQATGGSVNIAGHDRNGMGEDALALFRRDHVGIVFQAFHLVPTMTALENVAVPLELAGHRDAFEQARAGLDTVGLGHRLSHYPSQLSGGEQQRVALARAFVARPTLLLADEPTGNLDSEIGGQVIDVLFDLQKRHGSTLLLITHDEDVAARCHRVVRMQDGRIVADMPARTPVTVG